MRWVEIRMDCCGYAGEPLKQVWTGGIEKLVGNAEDTMFANGLEMVPVALRDDSFERDSISGSAPGEEENVRVGRGYDLRARVSARFAKISAAAGFNQFCDPGLGVDERLAPLFAVDDGRLHARG
jgi:hypothetical protein